MKFLIILMDSLVSFVQRNPFTVLVILLLALGAPALLKGIAVFILYALLGLAVIVAALVLLFRWKIAQARRQMERQFGEGFGGQDPFAGRNPFAGQSREAHRRRADEGEVKVYKTAETPEKRVSNDVGDYVDFEETKD